MTIKLKKLMAELANQLEILEPSQAIEIF